MTMLSEDELKNVPVLVFANKQVSYCLYLAIRCMTPCGRVRNVG